MTSFNNNKNSFLSSIQLLKSDLHSFQVIGVPKASKNAKQQKRALLSNITASIDAIDTDDFGIRVMIIRTDK